MYHEARTDGQRVFLCGTRVVRWYSEPYGKRRTEARNAVYGPVGHYRVLCATCDAGGTVKHPTKTVAVAAAVRDSARPCATCGAD